MTDLMSPMDSYGWFETPTVTGFAGTGAALKIASVNTRRVGLLIGSGQAMTTNIIGPFSNVATPGLGFVIGPNPPFIYLDQRTYGALVQGEWWWSSVGAQTLCVIELILRDPAQEAYNG